MNQSLKAYADKIHKANELQKLRVDPKFWVVGDAYLDESEKLKLFTVRVPERATWLPREDQLKAVFGTKFPMSAKLVTLDLARFAMSKQYEWSSCEELFLDFLMDRLFNKQWNGKDWVSL